MVSMVRGQPARLVGLETWDGWLIAGNTHDIFVIQNKLILNGYIHFKTIMLFLNLSTHFPNTTKKFLQLVENISNNPLPTSHPKNRVVNVCEHKFACTNVTPKQRNGAHFITHAPHCAWVISDLHVVGSYKFVWSLAHWGIKWEWSVYSWWFLSRQLNAIFVPAKLHQVSNIFETPAISRRQITLKSHLVYMCDFEVAT